VERERAPEQQRVEAEPVPEPERLPARLPAQQEPALRAQATLPDELARVQAWQVQVARARRRPASSRAR